MPQSRLRVSRAAFTLVELLVVISIIGVLMALLLPAVQAARAAAFRANCQNNLRQLGKGVDTYVAAKGKFPSSVSPTNVGGATYYFPWTIRLFPYIEQQAVHDEIVLRRPELSDPTDPLASQYITQDGTTLKRLFIPVLACTADADASENGALSYVANVGRPDQGPPFDTTGSQLDRNRKATGLFHNSGFRHEVTKNYVSQGDGLANTLLFAENMNATFWTDLDEANHGFVWVDTGDPGAPQQQINSVDRTSAGNYAFSRPSANHQDVFNAAFADGTVRALSQEVDQQTFYQAMTPRGDDTNVAWQTNPFDPKELEP